jgi:SAM-dependent methyltransferase
MQGKHYFSEEKTGDKIRRKIPSFLTRVPSTSIKPAKHELAYNRYVLGANKDALILNLGSGNEKTATPKRARGKGTTINLDIFPHSEAHVVADGHYLPFLNGVFDGVYMIAVLEHMYNPFAVAKEVTRVLKTGGFVLAASPFIFPIHGAPNDYFRFTDEGLRQLFSGFREIECDAHGLPTRALIEFLIEYIAAFSDNRYLAFALSYVVSRLLYPLKYIDKYLQKKKRAHNVCGSFYYVGTKESANTSLSDA